MIAVLPLLSWVHWSNDELYDTENISAPEVSLAELVVSYFLMHQSVTQKDTSLEEPYPEDILIQIKGKTFYWADKCFYIL